MEKLKKKLLIFFTMFIVVLAASAVSCAQDAKAAEDTVIYNLGNREITVGYDTKQAESTPWNYKLFDEDGSYTIQLEDDAFFPYEVQFKFNGETVIKWFETQNSTITVGGHTFRAQSKMTDESTVIRYDYSIRVDDDYISSSSGSKTFTNSPFQPFSILPLEEVRVSLDLRSYNRLQLSHVPVSDVINKLKEVTPLHIDTDSKIVLGYASPQNSGRFEGIVTQNDTIDLLHNFAYEDAPSLEIIVGSAKQLDRSNIKYIVDVLWNTPDKDQVVQGVDIYTEENGTRNRLESGESREQDYSGAGLHLYDFYIPRRMLPQTVYAGIRINPDYAGYTVRAVRGSYDYEYGGVTKALEALKNNAALDVTNKILKQDMTKAGTGLGIAYESFDKSNVSEWISLLFYDGDTVVDIIEVSISLIAENDGVYAIQKLRNDYNYTVSTESKSSRVNDVTVVTYTMNSEYPADAEYHLALDFIKNGRTELHTNRNYINRAVEGHYNSQLDAIGQEDIKEELLPSGLSRMYELTGYKGNYSGIGKNFTVFAEGTPYKFTVIAVDNPLHDPSKPAPTPKPIGINQDNYFRITGAKELWQSSENESGAYPVPYMHDSYYNMGYQTVLYTDDVALSSLRPVFWATPRILQVGDERERDVKVYSGHNGAAGTLQISGETVNDFSQGPLQYCVVVEGGRNLKNYWVSFVNKHSGGAKLFVNGINGGDGAKRELFLTRAQNAHSIFIANIGDEPLTGLHAVLDARNVKLDPFWTVGGENNNVMPAFGAAEIRLLSDGDGEISGTLRISADGQEDIVIELTGHAGDPRLLTADIPEAVKYVPYAVQILHNNKYSWNTVTMDVVSGELPQGVALNSNGELYGAPTETGTFTFEIEMTNSDSSFGSSITAYTLVVKENTNDNVDNSTDQGYALTKRIGTRIGDDDVITEIADYELISEGEIDEFVELWLNGVKLIENIDYIKEPGSTRITARGQTFQTKANQRGINTIATEFRKDGDKSKEMKRAAQNFKMDIPDKPSEPTSSNSGSKAPAPKPNTATTGELKNEVIVVSENVEQVPEWASSAMAELVEKKIITGYPDGGFKPLKKVTNVEFVVMLTNAFSFTAAGESAQFDGISDDAWFKNAIDVAFSNGIIHITDGNNFMPDKFITREDMCIMIVNALKTLDADLPETYNSDKFIDDNTISDYARDAVYTLKALQIVNGFDDGLFYPKTEVSRAQAAVVIHSVLKYHNR